MIRHAVFRIWERSMMKLEGYVEHIIYRNTDNGYSVLNLVSDEEEITVVGIFHYISEGEFLELEGEYTEHPLYGQQFHMERFEEKTPKDAMAIERYLCLLYTSFWEAILSMEFCICFPRLCW